jgi:gliding motility-associated-like protein
MKNFLRFLKTPIIILLFCFAGVQKIQAQDNTGKEFWFTLFAETYLDHLPGIYIVSYYDCSVTIDYVARDPLLDPAGDPECTRHTVNVIGGVPLYVDIPYDLQALCFRYADNLTVPETVQQNGIRVTSTAPIALYSQFFAAASSEMTPILPVEEMGTEYIATAYREITDIANEFNARASITGIEDNTSITFTLPMNAWTSSTNINGTSTHGPGSSWTITLNRGETYTVLSNDNGNALTTTPPGSTVTVNNNQGLNGLKIVANKKISVMGGTDCTWVGNDEYPGCGACDLTSTHLKPVDKWKTRYISTQTLQRPNQMSLAVGLAAPPTPNIEPFPAGFNNMSVADYLLITAKDNGTVVNISGQATYTKNLSAGQWFIYESPGNSNPLTPPPGTSPGMSNHVIQSNNPVQVIQMMKGWQCDNNNPADPTQMLVIEETMWRDNYIVTNPTQYINNFFVFIVKEPSGTNVARNSLVLTVNGSNVPIPTGNSPTNDGTLGWSRMGTVEPYYYQRVNIAAGGAIKARSVPLVPGGTTYPFAFYASGSTNASSYGYMGGAVCRLRAFAHADTANICLGTPVTFKLDSTQNGGLVATTLLYNYTWTMMNGASTVYTFSGIGADPTHPYTPTAAGTYTGYLDITDNAGCTARDTFTVVVNATIPAPTAGAAITVCQGQNINLTSNTSVTGVTYAWTGPGGYTSTAQNPVIANATAAMAGTYSVTISKNGCTSTAATTTVTVTPNPVITLTSAAGTNAQTLCVNNPITNITYSITGATGATVTGLPAGVSGSFSGVTFTISGTPSAAGTFNYTVTSSGGCSVVTANGTITVNPNAAIALTSAAGTNAQSVCINTAISNITYSVTGGGTGATVTGLPSGVSGTFAAGTFTISGTPSAAGTFNYTVTTTGTCTQTTATGSITVTPNAAITLTSAAGTNTQTVCVGNSITTITYSISGGGTGATVTGLPGGLSGAFAGGIFTISGSPSVAGTFNYTVNTTGTCTQASASGTITVNPNAIVTLTSPAGTNAQTVCVSSPINNITYSVTGGGTGATVTGLPAGVSGTFAGGTFTISGSPTATGTFNYTVTSTGACAPATATGSITVNPNAAITLTSGAATTTQSVCVSTPITTITYTISGGGTGATVTGLPAGVAGSFAGGTFTISGTPTATGTFNYTVNTTGSCAQTSAAGTITVNPNAAIALTSAAGTNAQTVCVSSPITNITYSVTGGGTGGTVTGLPAGVTGSFAGGTFTISGTPTATGTFNYTVNTTGTCTQTSATGSIIVNPNAAISLTSAAGTNAQTVCVNNAITNITYTVTGGGTGAGVTGLPAGVTGSFAGGIFTISGTPSAPGTFNFTITTTGTCTQATVNGSITVNPLPVITSTPSTNETSCGANDGTITINATGTGLTYSINGGTSFVATNNFTGLGGGTYNIVVQSASGCSVNGGTVSISSAGAPPTPTANATPNPLCDGATLTLSVAAPVAGETYNWSGPGGYTATGTTATITGVTTAMSGVYTVTANVGGCVSAGGSVTVTVNPNAAIALTSAAGTNNQTICSSTAINTITYSVTGGGTGATVTGLPAGVTGSFAGGTFTISGTPSAAGTFNYTVNTTGTCTQTSASGSIIVNPDASITLTSAPGTNTQTLCVNNSITPVTYSITGGGTGATVSGLPAGVTGSFAGGTFTISGTPGIAGTFNYTVNTTGTCAQATATGSIIVNPDAAIALTSAAGTNAQTVCVNTGITNITYSISGGGTGATATGLPPGVSGSFAGGIFTISGMPNASGTFNYTVTTTGSCTQANANGVITVNPDAVITLTSAAGTNSQAICMGDPLSSITYSVSGGGTGATISGLPAGVTGSFAGGTFTISGTPTAAGTFNYIINTTGTCAQTSASGSITVNPNATVALTSGAGTDAQSVCINTPITTITYTISGGATGATVSGLPAGISSSFSGGVLIISGTPSVTGLFNYSINTTGSCAPASSGGSITVNPDAAIALSSAAGTDAQTVCVNSAITAITYSVSGGGTGASVSGLPTGVTGSFAGGVFTISGIPTVTGSFNYTVTTTGTCIQTSASGTIIVDPNVIVALTSAAGTDAQSVCINTSITDITYSVTGGTGASVTGLPSGVTGTFSAGVFTISGTPGTSGTFNYTVTSSGGCNQSASGSITVNPLPVITAVPFTNETSCGAADGTITINATGTGLTYSIDGGTTFFASNTFTGLSGGTYNIVVQNVSGCIASGGTISLSSAGAPASPSATASPNPICEGNTLTLSVSTPVTGETYTWSGPGLGTPTTGSSITINAVTTAMSGTYNVVASVGGCNSVAGSVVVTVNPNAAITLTSAVSTNNQTVCNNTAITDITYSITGGGTGATVTGLPAGVTGSFAAGMVTISGTPSATGTFNYTVNTTGSCAQTSATGTITVSPDAAIALTSAAGSNSQVLCNGNTINNITYSVTGGGTGANVTGLPAGVSGSFAAGVFTISGTPSVTGTFNYTVNTTGTCAQTSASGTITINPDAAIALTSPASTSAQTVCEGSSITSITYSVSGGGTGATVSGLPSGVTGSFAGGVFTISGTPSSAGTFSYTVNTTGTCLQTSASGTITVNPNASIVLTSAAGTSSQTICPGSAISNITYSVLGGGTGASATGLPPGVTGSFAGGIFTISGTPTTTGTFSYTVTTTGTCLQANASGTVTINTLQNASFTYSSATFCQSAADPTPAITGVSGGSFTSSPGGLTMNPSTGAITLATSSINTYTITYTTPGPCANSSTVTLSITANPTASASASTQVCSGESISLSSTGGGTYTWSGPGSYTSASQNPMIDPASVVNSGTYTVTVNSGGCTDTAQVYVNVTPTPSADAGMDLTIEQGTSTVLNASGGTSYTWTPATGLSCTNCPDPTATPVVTTTYCVETANGSCSDNDCVTITVRRPCNTNEDMGVPNAFSPNNDGNNDEFCLQGWSECMDQFSIIIFDRWGEKIMEANEADFCWDGTFRGQTLDPAVFVYFINATFSTGEKITKKGNISIIR